MLNGNELNYQKATLTNDGFWPDLELADFQKKRSIPTDLDSELLKEALLATVTEINFELSDVKLRYQAKGYQTAAEVPGAMIEKNNALTSQYKKAVFARAKADLLGEFGTLTPRAPHQGQESPEIRGRLLTEAAVTIRNMKGLRRTGVYLI